MSSLTGAVGVVLERLPVGASLVFDVVDDGAGERSYSLTLLVDGKPSVVVVNESSPEGTMEALAERSVENAIDLWVERVRKPQDEAASS